MVNTPAGVVIEVWGLPAAIDRLIDRLRDAPPPLARLDAVEVAPVDGPAPTGFRIDASRRDAAKTVLVTPDADVCPRCRQELFSPGDRRYRYPFINCTDCGPRYTLIDDLPYDRQRTAMAPFAMCPDCLAEYRDPDSRRFHAEATCCPACGPQICLVDAGGAAVAGEPLATAAALLQQGNILAIKGIGGFHLVVDAENDEALGRLRRYKDRPHKPFAVMAASLAALRRFAVPSEQAEKLLTSREKPIVLLPKKAPCPLAEAVAPAIPLVGVMLPYTPLHILLLDLWPGLALVMTSGNLAGEPIVRDNGAAMEKLAGIARYVLLHDRRIVTAIDDSVVRPQSPPILIRRARGYAPSPLPLSRDNGRVLGVGGNMKNTVCLTRGRQAFVSQHLGEPDLLATQENLVEVIAHLEKLLQVSPELVAHDLHPGYFTSDYASSHGGDTVAVQHHHAHAVSVMAEHGLAGPVVAITLDGTGYGSDTTVWGGEVLLARLDGFDRLAHLRPVPMPGGEAAIREPWRMALACLHAVHGSGVVDLPLSLLEGRRPVARALVKMMEAGVNAPLTSSCGRLFDAAAALAGIRGTCTHEGQAALELEMAAIAAGGAGFYPYSLSTGTPVVIDPLPGLLALIEDMDRGTPAGLAAGRFHRMVVEAFAATAVAAAAKHGLDTVVLSGGVFQNALIGEGIADRVAAAGLRVCRHRLLPPNDGCISLGQAVAGWWMRKNG